MRKLLWALLLTIVVGLSTIVARAGSAPAAFPVDNVSELSSNLVGMRENACEHGTLGALFRFERGTVRYTMLVLVSPKANTQHFILADEGEGDSTPVWIGLITLDGKFVVRRELTFGEFTHELERYPDGVCGVFGREA